jgi:hypothetical protein
VLRADLGPNRSPIVVHGVPSVAKLARAPQGAQLHPVLVNGTVGAVVTLKGQPFSIMAFTVIDGKIIEIDGIADPDRVQRLATDVLTHNG